MAQRVSARCEHWTSAAVAHGLRQTAEIVTSKPRTSRCMRRALGSKDALLQPWRHHKVHDTHQQKKKRPDNLGLYKMHRLRDRCDQSMSDDSQHRPAKTCVSSIVLPAAFFGVSRLPQCVSDLKVGEIGTKTQCDVSARLSTAGSSFPECVPAAGTKSGTDTSKRCVFC